jgi:hypothetical protein
MKRALIVASVVAAAVAAVPGLSHAGVNVDINVGVPFPAPVVVAPPPPVVALPPRLVVVPGSPVYYAPAFPFDVFFYRGLYYRPYHNAWFSAPYYGGPWRPVAYASVPRHLLAVPVHYYKIPPGQRRKLEAGRAGWHGGGRHRWGGRE